MSARASVLHAAARLGRARRSIRLRLTLWSAATIFLVLALGTAVTRTVIDAVLHRQFERSLDGSAALLQGFFRLEVAEHRYVEATAEHMMTETLLADREIRILRPDGSAVEVSAIRPAVRLGAPVRTVEAPLDADLAPGWRVRVRASGAETEATLARLDAWFAAGLAAGVLVSAIAGWMLTGRALRPVGAMADAADAIGPGETSTRLPVANPGDELGRLARHFNAMLGRLDAALGQQRRFIADAAHELRTPMARMRSQVELALLERRGDASARATLGSLEAELARAARLVSELLVLARADAGVHATRTEMGYLDDVVLSAVRSWRAAASERGITLTLSRVDETPMRLDSDAISRLFGALVENALRYTPRGGRVDVRVFTDAGDAVLEVEDSGMGIAPEERERVFERFYRGSAVRSVVPEGSGLGLAIARSIVEQHGGRIELLGGASGGTLVRVRMPCGSATPRESTRVAIATRALTAAGSH
jgi:two-component system OmpR family sensor kinase